MIWIIVIVCMVGFVWTVAKTADAADDVKCDSITDTLMFIGAGTVWVFIGFLGHMAYYELLDHPAPSTTTSQSASVSTIQDDDDYAIVFPASGECFTHEPTDVTQSRLASAEFALNELRCRVARLECEQRETMEAIAEVAGGEE